MEFVNAALVMPGGPEELDTRGVLKNMAKGMQIATSDVMRSDDESEAAIEEAKNNPPMDPETQKLQAQQQLKQMEIDWDREKLQLEGQNTMVKMEGERQIALITRETELTKLAATTQVSLEKVRGDNQIKKYQTDWSIKAFYEELKQKKEEGQTANYGLEADAKG